MSPNRKLIVAGGFCLVLLSPGCQQTPPDTRAADEAAIRSMNPTWFTAYNTGDVNTIVALYAEDAVVNAPGRPAVRGGTAIRQFFTDELAGSGAAGITLHPGPTDVGASGDLCWLWGTVTATDKSGTTVDSGKYVTVCERREGKWLIVRDIWNSDSPAQEPAMN